MSVIAAVLGSPVSHSLSPAIHRAAFVTAGRAGDYSAIECQATTLEATLISLRDGGAIGGDRHAGRLCAGSDHGKSPSFDHARGEIQSRHRAGTAD